MKKIASLISLLFSFLFIHGQSMIFQKKDGATFNVNTPIQRNDTLILSLPNQEEAEWKLYVENTIWWKGDPPYLVATLSNGATCHFCTSPYLLNWGHAKHYEEGNIVYYKGYFEAKTSDGLTYKQPVTFKLAPNKPVVTVENASYDYLNTDIALQNSTWTYVVKTDYATRLTVHFWDTDDAWNPGDSDFPLFAMWSYEMNDNHQEFRGTEIWDWTSIFSFDVSNEYGFSYSNDTILMINYVTDPWDLKVIQDFVLEKCQGTYIYHIVTSIAPERENSEPASAALYDMMGRQIPLTIKNGNIAYPESLHGIFILRTRKNNKTYTKKIRL